MIEEFTDPDYWRTPMRVDDSEDVYQWLTSSPLETLKAMLAVRSALDDFPPTRATFAVSDIVDAYDDLTLHSLPQEALWIMGIWPVPPVIRQSHPRLYVNPDYQYRSSFADVYYKCCCGAVLDVCPAARYHENHASNYHLDGCEKWEQIHARTMLHEVRYDILVNGVRMGLSFREMSHRLGLSPESVRGDLLDWDAERMQRERDLGKLKLAETYRWLHHDLGVPKVDLARVFPHTSGTMKDYIQRFTSGDEDARGYGNRPNDRIQL